MSTNLLLRRRAMMAASSASGGGGTEDDPNAPITFTINVTGCTSDGIDGYIEFSKPLPYDINIITSDDDYGDSVYFSVPAGTTYYDFYKNDRYWSSLEPMYVSFFGPYDISYRIIPTHIYAVLMPEFTHFNAGLGQYLYASNINYLPISEDDIGPNGEVCPILDLYDLKNTDQNVIWYNYNSEILFRDLYTGLIYALNRFGDLYQWN